MDGVGELAVKDFLRMVRDLDSNHHTEAANSSMYVNGC